MAITVLLADTDARQRLAYAAALRTVADKIYTAATFGEARDALVDVSPDVLVTQVRLAEFNGLHLASWGRRHLPNLRCAIIGESDPALEADVREAGCFYIRFNDEQAVLQAASEAAFRDQPRRRWRRKRLRSKLVSRVDNHAVLVLEVGYGGFCAQLPSLLDAQPESSFTFDIPALEMRAQATCRWVAPGEPSGPQWFGASLADDDIRAGSRWRQLVDTLSAEPAVDSE